MSAADDPRFEDARQLWAGRFQAVLTTHSQSEPGYPFASVVPYCLDRAGRPLLLLSHLAQHTKNLIADARCGLCVAEPTDGDVQQTLRLSCIGDCNAVDAADIAAMSRWLRYFPESLVYVRELNFRLYRLIPKRIHYNGGFATARWLGTEHVLRPFGFDETGEAALLGALSDLQPPLDLMDRNDAAPLRYVGVDPWGLDLSQSQRLRRVPLPGPLETAEGLRETLLANGFSKSASAQPRVERGS